MRFVSPEKLLSDFFVLAPTVIQSQNHEGGIYFGIFTDAGRTVKILLLAIAAVL